MALHATASAPAGITRRSRLPGPDVVRGAALIGVVVLNYHGYLILRGGPRTGSWAADLFDPWTGPLATRFAATFVLVAGVGVTLLTAGAIGSPSRVTEMRWRLARRGTLLYVVGIALDEIWAGTIIPYYGAMFAIAALLFTLRSRWIVAIGIAAALGGWGLRTWRFWRVEDGDNVDWLFSPSPGAGQRYPFSILVNGTHPLLPWLSFLCAGMVLGRLLAKDWWRPAALTLGVTLFGLASLVGSAATTKFEVVLLSTDPFERGLIYTASALGTALIAYASLDWAANRFPRATDPLRRAGQMTLTLYLGHVLVFIVLVRRLRLIEPGGLDVALIFALGYWIAAIALSVWWSRRFGRGPAEGFYRTFGG
jgi:uncharacterized membrane protein YeiB